MERCWGTKEVARKERSKCAGLKAGPPQEVKERRREISLCAGRPFHRSEMGRKSRPAPFEMTGGGRIGRVAHHNCSYIYIATSPELYFAATKDKSEKRRKRYGENREEGSF
jgi:hypothetical protein